LSAAPLVRMPESRYLRMAWEVRYEGRRTRGRPRTKWQDNFQNALLEKGVDWRQARTRAQDRKIWHALCQTSTPGGRRGSTSEVTWYNLSAKKLQTLRKETSITALQNHSVLQITYDGEGRANGGQWAMPVHFLPNDSRYFQLVLPPSAWSRRVKRLIPHSACGAATKINCFRDACVIVEYLWWMNLNLDFVR
jgi:hypothetical protein